MKTIIFYARAKFWGNLSVFGHRIATQKRENYIWQKFGLHFGSSRPSTKTYLINMFGALKIGLFVSFQKRFLLLSYTFISYVSIFYQYNVFPNVKSLFCGSQN